jgi:hypothetical protein
MVFFLYSDKNCEHQAIACIKSLTGKVTDDVQLVYYTIGFKTDFSFKNLTTIQIAYKNEYPRFHFYKAELSLKTIKLFPNEDYIFSDTDILYSRKFDFNLVKHNLPYPLASYGPHEYPYMWYEINGETVIYDEKKLMNYFSVPHRTQRYVWSCFYSFNSSCTDFFEEYTSMCKNQYLLKDHPTYFPYADETSFNVCLWKRNATQNLEYAFVNTHKLETVKHVEEGNTGNAYMGNNLDAFGADWEYIHDPAKVLLYHGFKEKEEMNIALDYLIN